MMENLGFYVQKFGAGLHGFVIMPNHVHLLLSMGDNGTVSQLMGQMKEYSAKQIIEWCKENGRERLLAIFEESAKKYRQAHRYQVWQHRFDDLLIENEKTFLIKMNYIHNNPLQERWGLVSSPEEYRFSSARFYYKGEDAGVPISVLEAWR